MQYTINELYAHIYEKVDSVYEVFKGFFGENYVDLHKADEGAFKKAMAMFLHRIGVGEGCGLDQFDTPIEVSDDLVIEKLEERFKDTKSDIFVWWPRVTVTNEYNKSIHIQDLYAKVTIQFDGRIPYEYPGFKLNRATYPLEQFLSGYMHSHINHIPKEAFEAFQIPCLGNGPIKETISTLKNDYDEVTWMLFCQELAMYVTVESLHGGPWKRLESVGIRKVLGGYTGYDFRRSNRMFFERFFSKDVVIEFIKYYLEKGHLSLSFKEGKFTSGMTYYDYMVDVSNTFIDFYNRKSFKTLSKVNEMFAKSILIKALVIEGKFYRTDSQQVALDIDSYQDKLVLTFKGKPIKTKILSQEGPTELHFATLLSQDMAMYVLNSILTIINFRYRNGYTDKYRAASPAYKDVIYL